MRMNIFFTLKVASTRSEIWVGIRDLASGKNLTRIPNHGAKKALGSPIRNNELAFKKGSNLVNIEALSGLELEVA
jgi:hypothetical protein